MNRSPAVRGWGARGSTRIATERVATLARQLAAGLWALLSCIPAAWGADPAVDLRRAILAAGQVSQVLRVQDAAIDAAAGELARLGASGLVERPAIRTLLWSRGIKDFEFRPIVIVGAAPEPAQIELAVRRSHAEEPVWNTFGVGSYLANGVRVTAAILVRRDARWGGAVEVGEHPITVSDGLGQPRLYVTHPDGRVEVRPGRTLGKRGWDVDDRPGNTAGSWLFELVADGAGGPRILALWAEVVGRDLGTGSYGAAQDLEGETRPPDGTVTLSAEGVRAQEALLWRLIQEVRASRGLPPLRHERGIAEAARVHARDLARGERFGHVTSSGNALDRLGQHGVVAIRALENAAIARDVSEAHLALLASPAHRMNLLDPGVDTGGVGVVLRREPDGRVSACLSMVFAVLRPEDGPGLRDSAIEHAQQARVRLELPLLRSREVLDRIAGKAVDAVVAAGTTNLDEAQRRALIDEVAFHFRNAQDVGLSFLVTADPAAVGRVAHLRRAAFSEMGVAVRTSPIPLGEQPTGVLVVALVFVAR